MNGFGKVIWQLRHDHNMSQPMFADLVSGLTGEEITRSAISMWERGQRMPKADTIIKIANVFSMDVDDILGVAKADPLYQEGEGKPGTDAGAGRMGELELAVSRADDRTRALIKRILGYSDSQVAAFLLLLQSLPNDQGAQDAPK